MNKSAELSKRLSVCTSLKFDLVPFIKFYLL